MKKIPNLVEESLKQKFLEESPHLLDDVIDDHFNDWLSESDPHLILQEARVVCEQLDGLIKDLMGDLDKAPLGIGDGVDVTEVPDGLAAELTGLKKGWKAGLSHLQERLHDAKI